jgi:anti-anti-sigma regulatory factor
MSSRRRGGLTQWRRRDRSFGASDLADRTSKGASRLGAPEEPQAASIQARRAAHDPNTLIVTLRGVIDRNAAARLDDEVGDVLGATGVTLVICDLGRVIQPNAATVDAVCRVRLAARRLGCPLRLRHASPELLDLLDLMGLCDVDEGSVREGGGQAEQREHALGIEEEGDPRDLPA